MNKILFGLAPLAAILLLSSCRTSNPSMQHSHPQGKIQSFGENPLHVKIIPSILEKNPCYKTNRKIEVKGLMLHSVGCPQPSASVFVNHWNNENYGRACVHAFIDANTGEVWQTLPWDHFGWHGASGPNGSVNATHIGVEMCEPASLHYVGGATFECSDPENARILAQRTYDSAVNLFAFLCWKFNLDPLADGVIISHHEGHLRGIASGHVDPEHLWTQLQMPLTMDKFRQDVNEHLNAYKAFRDSSWRMFKNRWWNNAIRGNELGPME